MKATRVRIYPTAAQAEALEKIAGCCRLVYNVALEQRRDHWRRFKACHGNTISWYSQKRELPALKQEAPFLAEVPSHCLQMALQDLDTAYRRFFDGIGGYPRPRRKFEHDSFTFPDPAQIRITGLKRGWGDLILPKFGKSRRDSGALSIRLHRPLQGRLRRVTISRDGSHWYASILMQARHRQEPERPSIAANDVVGIDRGVEVPFALSDGTEFGHAVETGRMRERQRRLSRALSRTKRGSKRRYKARKRLAAHGAKMSRRRRDMVHKVTSNLAKNHRGIVIEKLRVQAMTASARGTAEEPGRNVAQKAGLNRAILDRGWGEFRRQLQYKLAWSGGVLVEVPARDTSRSCASCGHVDAASRRSRSVFACVACGHEDHADTNAAIEIRRRGLVALGLETRKEWSGQPGEPSALALAVKREEKNDGISAAAFAAA